MVAAIGRRSLRPRPRCMPIVGGLVSARPAPAASTGRADLTLLRASVRHPWDAPHASARPHQYPQAPADSCGRLQSRAPHIDPRSSALRGAPREVRDLVAAARNSWLVCFDNLGHLPQDLADAACRLATGGGFGGRELYSDYDEAVFDATRPLVFNAIPDLGATRPDFLDRALIIEFHDIKPEARRDEREFWREFEAARPRILGALLNAVALGLRKLPSVALGHLPRMVDFASWASDCEDGLGLDRGKFLKVYEANRADARDLALESSPIYEPLRELAREGFTGSSAELLTRLNNIVSEHTRRSVRWPKAPNALASTIGRMASNLRATGIDLQSSRVDRLGKRIVSVNALPVVPKRSSVTSASLVGSPAEKK